MNNIRKNCCVSKLDNNKQGTYRRGITNTIDQKRETYIQGTMSLPYFTYKRAG